MNNAEAWTKNLGAWRLARWSAIAALLLLPTIAMRFTDEVAWTASDFAFAGVLLVGAGALYEIVTLAARRPAHRMLIGAALVGVVALIWAEGAVGILPA